MIRSTECARCEQELVFPSEWVDRSIKCPQCGNVVAIIPEMIGEKRARRTLFPRRFVRAAGAIALVSGLVLLFMMPWEQSVQAVQDPMLRFRCTHCDRVHQRARAGWEREVLASIDLTESERAKVVPIPEEIASKCPNCGQAAAYLQSRTSLCPDCGHWAPSFEPLILSALRRAPVCSHCASPGAGEDED